MAGMDRTSGTALEGVAHIRQSVTDILTTPLGSRVMRRDYGSLLPELIDQPLDGATALRAYAACVVALMRWEPRIRETQIQRHVSAERPGRLTLSVQAERIDDGADLTFDIPLGQET